MEALHATVALLVPLVTVGTAGVRGTPDDATPMIPSETPALLRVCGTSGLLPVIVAVDTHVAETEAVGLTVVPTFRVTRANPFASTGDVALAKHATGQVIPL